MKLRNRIMSWILSPGAYAVWHALGNPEEWRVGQDDLTHTSTEIAVTVLDWRRAGIPAPIGATIACIVGGFSFDCEGSHKGAIGHFERHLIAGRAYRLMSYLHRNDKRQDNRKANRAVFIKLTVNE